MQQMEKDNVKQIIRSFLFSGANKQLLIFSFFLVLSFVFWLIITLNETYEREIKVAVNITNVPNNIVLTSDDTDTMRVTVRDKGWVLLAYLHTRQSPAVNITYKNFDNGDGTGSISASEAKRYIQQKLESSTVITSIKPDKLEIFYNNGECKRVPVRWTGRVIPEHLYFISNVIYWPDSVDVYAAREKLDSIRVVYTETLNYANFRDTLIVDCRLSHSKDMKIVPENIKVGFFTDVLTEESIDGVPVQAINMPEGKVLRTFPPKVKVHFVSGVSRLKHIKPSDFTVIADYNEISQNPSEKCNIYLRATPQGISRATLDIKQVDYLIEEE